MCFEDVLFVVFTVYANEDNVYVPAVYFGVASYPWFCFDAVSIPDIDYDLQNPLNYSVEGGVIVEIRGAPFPIAALHVYNYSNYLPGIVFSDLYAYVWNANLTITTIREDRIELVVSRSETVEQRLASVPEPLRRLVETGVAFVLIRVPDLNYTDVAAVYVDGIDVTAYRTYDEAEVVDIFTPDIKWLYDPLTETFMIKLPAHSTHYVTVLFAMSYPQLGIEVTNVTLVPPPGRVVVDKPAKMLVLWHVTSNRTLAAVSFTVNITCAGPVVVAASKTVNVTVAEGENTYSTFVNLVFDKPGRYICIAHVQGIPSSPVQVYVVAETMQAVETTALLVALAVTALATLALLLRKRRRATAEIV